MIAMPHFFHAAVAHPGTSASVEIDLSQQPRTWQIGTTA
jgi:hypothetical protein